MFLPRACRQYQCDLAPHNGLFRSAQFYIYSTPYDDYLPSAPPPSVDETIPVFYFPPPYSFGLPRVSYTCFFLLRCVGNPASVYLLTAFAMLRCVSPANCCLLSVPPPFSHSFTSCHHGPSFSISVIAPDKELAIIINVHFLTHP